MSWTQGVQTREELPQWFVEWADSKLGEPLRCVVWDDAIPDIAYLDGDNVSAKMTRRAK